MALCAIYDSEGAVSGWSEADRLYSAGGSFVGWLRAGAVYSLAGSHVGWLERGHFRDDRGCVVGWTRDALGSPGKPAATDARCPDTLASPPTLPSLSRRMSRIPFSSTWSTESWESYLR
jgi:hypothetical protein